MSRKKKSDRPRRVRRAARRFPHVEHDRRQTEARIRHRSGGNRSETQM